MRAGEGAAIGAIVGLISGAVIGGALRAVDRSSLVPLVLGLGIFGAATISNAVIAALPPEC